jgi:hypothetical protein
VPIAAAVAAAFSAAGLWMLLISVKSGYYYLYFVPWALAALGCLWSAMPGVRFRRGLLLPLAVLLALAWLPSLAWNVLRVREAARHYGDLDKQPMVVDLRATVPGDANVRGDPRYFVVAHKAGLRFTPVPWFLDDPGMAAAIPARDWLILSWGYRKAIERCNPSFFRHRARMGGGTMFRTSPFFVHEYLIYGPATHSPAS